MLELLSLLKDEADKTEVLERIEEMVSVVNAQAAHPQRLDEATALNQASIQAVRVHDITVMCMMLGMFLTSMVFIIAAVWYIRKVEKRIEALEKRPGQTLAA